MLNEPLVQHVVELERIVGPYSRARLHRILAIAEQVFVQGNRELHAREDKIEVAASPEFQLALS